MESVEGISLEYEVESGMVFTFLFIPYISGIAEQVERGVCRHWKLMESAAERLHGEVESPSLCLANADLKEVGDVFVGLPDVIERRVGLFDAPIEGSDVLVVVEQHGVGCPSVTPRTSGLLEVCLERVGHVVMDDQPHVGLVDSHAEGVRRHHHAHSSLRPVNLAKVLLGIRQTCMVVAGRDTVVDEESCELDRLLTCTGIDDGTARHSLQHVKHLAESVFGLAHHIDEVLAFEAHREDIFRTKTESRLYVGHHPRCSCGCERQYRHIL